MSFTDTVYEGTQRADLIELQKIQVEVADGRDGPPKPWAASYLSDTDGPCIEPISSHSEYVKKSPCTILQVVTEHEDQVEALRLLMELLQSAEGRSVPLRVACDDGTIREIEVGESEQERQEVLAILRRQLSRILH